MKNIANYKSTNRANIIPINRTTKKDVPLVINAINNVINHFDFENDQKKSETLGKLIYKINLLDLQEGDLVFEIGTGNGLQAAVMAAMGAQVITIAANVTNSSKSIPRLNKSIQDKIEIYSIKNISSAGSQAPFDKIIVSPQASNLPTELYALLSVNGKMLISNDDQSSPTFLEVTRTADDAFDVKKKTGLKDKTASYEVFDL